MKFKRIIALVLAALMLIGLTACEGSNDKDSGDVTFWSTYSTLKVFQDYPDAYDDVKFEAKIDLDIARGEKEAAQIIMTSKKEVEYELEVSDLKSGDNVLDKSHVTVYHEKYIFIVGTEYYTDEGYYPDCLVPYENVKSVGENVISENSNQGLYIRFDVPTEQTPGTYTGSIKVKAGDTEKTIPVSLNVLNAYITEETHTLSVFNNCWYMSRGELDTTLDMIDAYVDALTDYRCGVESFVTNSAGTDEEIRLYAQRACEYVKRKDSICFCIPKSITAYENLEFEGETFSGDYVYDPYPIYNYYKILAEVGLENDVDVFSKAIQIGYDEPNGTAAWKIQQSSHIIRLCKNKIIRELKADESITNTELRDAMCESIDKMPHVVTASIVFDIDWNLGEKEDFVYAPYFSWAESPSARSTYRIDDDNQLWWYGCCSPDYPYPTYHTDDTLISSRVVSWMQYEYDVIGNLYWAVDTYHSGTTSEVDKTGYLEDYYANPIRSAKTNGEGYLFYPGKKYGVNGPLPTLRIESIRDGLEEYELMYYLGEKYAEVNARTGKTFDEKNIISSLGSTMYTGTKVYTTDATFAEARSNLLMTCNLAASPACMLITDSREGSDYMDFDVYCNDGYAPTYNVGEEIGKTQLNGGSLYTIRVKIGSAASFDVGVTIDGVYNSISNKLPSVATVYDANYLLGKVNEFSKKAPCEISIANGIGGTESAVKLNFTEYAASAATIHSVKLTDKETIGRIGAQSDKLMFRLYNDSDKDVMFIIGIEYGDEEGIYNETEFILTPGMNTVAIKNLSGIKWSKRLNIKSIRLMIGGDPYATADNLVYKGRFVCEANANVYLVDMSIFNV